MISSLEGAPAAPNQMRFSVLVKANIGGSGAGIVRCDTPEELQVAVDAGEIDMGIDKSALVQEFLPKRDGHITRAEEWLAVLDGVWKQDHFWVVVQSRLPRRVAV